MVKKSKKPKSGYTLLAPEIFGHSPVGETLADSPEKLVGRRITATLGDITGDPSKQNTRMVFQVEKVDGDKAHTRYDGHQLTKDYMRSLSKRRTSHVAAILSAKTKDGVLVRVAASCFTIKKTNEKQTKAIRASMARTLQEKAAALDSGAFVQEIVLGKVAADIYKDAKKIYPMRRVEIERSKVV